MLLNKIALFLLLTNVVSAQPNVTAKIEAVTKDGVHRIVLPAALRSFSKNNLADFRIYNQAGNEVPYQIANPNLAGTYYNFKPFQIISKTVVETKSTSIVLENPKPELNEISLNISNAEVTKKFSVSGSADLKNWFGLVNKRELPDITNENTSSQYVSIPLPLNTYKYIRIDFDDKKTLPLNVLQAGYFDRQFKSGLSEKVNPQKITKTERREEKITLIDVTFAHPQAFTAFRLILKRLISIIVQSESTKR